MTKQQSPPTVLVVDDEPDLATLYATWLQPEYSVSTALSGEEALQALDEHIEIVLLDRNMPDLLGDEVLREIRGQEYGYLVAMVSAVDPDFDIIEMGCDEYLTKPVSKDELLETVDRLLRWATYDEQLREYFSLTSKKALLETTISPSSLAASEDYTELVENIDELETCLSASIDQFSESELTGLFRAIESD